MTRTLLGGLSALFMTVGTASAAPEDVKPVKEWKGIHRDESLKSAAPAKGFVQSKEEWQKLWKAWKIEGEAPEIDFTKNLVIVATISGPNRMFARMTREDGDVKVLAGGTKIGGPGFGYLLAQIARSGVKSVNGKEVK